MTDPTYVTQRVAGDTPLPQADLYEALIPEADRKWFEESARNEENVHWERGDRALAIVSNFRRARTRGELSSISENDVWSAIAFYCNKGPKRIKQIATVCAIYPPEVRHPHLSFNYYEAASQNLPAEHWQEGITWLSEVLADDGSEYPGQGAMKVTDFIRKYKVHAELILPIEAGMPVAFEGVDPDGEPMSSVPAMAFQSLLEAPKTLRRLSSSKDRTPNMAILLDLLAEVERIIPAVMKEIGLTIPGGVGRQSNSDSL